MRNLRKAARRPDTSHEFIYTPSFRWLKKIAALLTNTPQYGRLIARAYVD